MISVEPISDEQWLVTVRAATTTQHRVNVSVADLRRFGGDHCGAEKLLEASFRFLLEREPNTAILRTFDLMVIARYFPEYEKEIARHLSPPA